jgi:ATP-binding cassette subfamily B protein
VSSQPFGDGRAGERRHAARADRSQPVRPPEDISAAHVSLRRIGALFKPYRVRLSGLLALIFLAAGLGVISPFLLRGVIDTAIPQHDTKLLTLLVGGMIALSIVGGAIVVTTTGISKQVGKSVMNEVCAAE